MATRHDLVLRDFERAFNEFFDELLIDRWKCGKPASEFERVNIVESEDRYEVRIAAAGIDPSLIDAQVSGQRLSVRMPARLGGTVESSFSFSESIDSEASAARWTEGVLTISLPKRKGKKVTLKNG